ncbi:MAG TPA: M50 family metallopeptidase, partial [Candidatus Kapabacteria bacterium]|nr:M50 family metallopeptidase [Candidatus Kapabacteria bacterium]
MTVPEKITQKHFNKYSPWYFSGFSLMIIIVWNIPDGFYYLYPLTILATYFHEMGHGLAALLLGGNFHYLLVHPDGSGVAVHSGVQFLGPIGQAIVAIGGPLGPTFAGMLFIYASA